MAGEFDMVRGHFRRRGRSTFGAIDHELGVAFLAQFLGPFSF
jgi:hypothetical protein